MVSQKMVFLYLREEILIIVIINTCDCTSSLTTTLYKIYVVFISIYW